MSILDQEVSFLTRFIVESDAIENITADSQLIETQLKTRWRKGHVGAMLLLKASVFKKNKVITENLICRVQGLITAEQHIKGGPKLKPEWIGKYRLINVSIGGRLSPNSTLVPALIKSWVSRVIDWQKACSQYLPNINLRQIAIFHYEYEHIHPFVDGNGRSGRALVYYLARYCGINPFIFTSDDKYETYYQCFNNSEEMCKYFEGRSEVMSTLPKTREKRRALVIEAMGNMIRIEDRENFFQSRHPFFGNRRPEDMLDSEEETQLIIKSLKRAESGGFA